MNCFVTEGWGGAGAVEGKITFFAITWIRFIGFKTKFGMDILLDPRNTLVEEFFIFLKIHDGRRRSKIEFRHNFGSKFTFKVIASTWHQMAVRMHYDS